MFSAGVIGHVEVCYPNDAEKNELCTAIPHPDSDIDWLRAALANTLKTARWRNDPELTSWLGGSRLDALSRFGLNGEPDSARLEILASLIEHTPGAIINLQRLLADD